MAIHDEICRSIDRFKDQAIGLGRQIHARPELKFEERFAAGLLTGALTEIGVEVERGVAGLETAFRAETGKSDRSGPTVAILAEYDALPNGHSCGHNLICTAALSAFAGLAAIRAQLPGCAMGGRERARGGDPDFPERRRRAAPFSRRLTHPRHHHRRRSGGEYHPRK